MAANFVGAVGTASSSAPSGTASFTLDLSSLNIAEGDLAVLFCGSNGGFSSIASTGSWTSISPTSFDVQYLELGASDSTFDIDLSVTNGRGWAVAIGVWRGWNGAAPTEVGYENPDPQMRISTDDYPSSQPNPLYVAVGFEGRASGVSLNVGDSSPEAYEAFATAVGGGLVTVDDFSFGIAASPSGVIDLGTTVGGGIFLLDIGGDPDPDPDTGWWVEVWDLDNTQRLMDDDPPVIACQFERILNDIGSGVLTVPAGWSRINEVCDPPNDVSTLIKVYISGVFRYAFRADQVERTYSEDAGAVTRIFGAGFEAIVDDGDIPAFDYPANPSISPDWVYGWSEIYTQGFEADSLDGWGGSNFAATGGTNGALSTAAANSGTASVVFTTGATDISPDNAGFYRTFTTEPGRQYKATGYVNGTGDYFWFARDLEADGAADFSPASDIAVGGTVTGTGGATWDELTMTFTAPSATTRFAVITDTLNHTFYLDDITVEEGAAGASIGAIVYDILAASQAQSNMTTLTENFSDAADTRGSAWVPSTLAMTVQDGPPFGTLLDRAAGLGYEWEVVPVGFNFGQDEGYELKLFNPSGLGVDFTGLSNAPTIRGGSILFGGTSRQHISKNVVRVTTAGGYWAESSDAASTAAVGRRVESIQNSQVEGTAIAQEIADARLSVHQDQASSLWLELSEESNDVLPFFDFNVGDTIKVEMSDSLGINGWFRVREIRADLTGEGNGANYVVDLRPT